MWCMQDLKLKMHALQRRLDILEVNTRKPEKVLKATLIGDVSEEVR